jgi:hypothetical protein
MTMPLVIGNPRGDGATTAVEAVWQGHRRDPKLLADLSPRQRSRIVLDYGRRRLARHAEVCLGLNNAEIETLAKVIGESILRRKTELVGGGER